MEEIRRKGLQPARYLRGDIPEVRVARSTAGLDPYFRTASVSRLNWYSWSSAGCYPNPTTLRKNHGLNGPAGVELADSLAGPQECRLNDVLGELPASGSPGTRPEWRTWSRRTSSSRPPMSPSMQPLDGLPLVPVHALLLYLSMAKKSHTLASIERIHHCERVDRRPPRRAAQSANHISSPALIRPLSMCLS
jgi:hypothetical protein